MLHTTLTINEALIIEIYGYFLLQTSELTASPAIAAVCMYLTRYRADAMCQYILVAEYSMCLSLRRQSRTTTESSTSIPVDFLFSNRKRGVRCP
jgi:hypothetical protein